MKNPEALIKGSAIISLVSMFVNRYLIQNYYDSFEYLNQNKHDIFDTYSHILIVVIFVKLIHTIFKNESIFLIPPIITSVAATILILPNITHGSIILVCLFFFLAFILHLPLLKKGVTINLILGTMIAQSISVPLGSSLI